MRNNGYRDQPTKNAVFAEIQPVTAAEDFEAVELLHATCNAAGWSIEYRQLERGRLHARTLTRETGNLVMLRESADLRLEVTGEPPNGTVFVMLPLGTGVLHANGNRLRRGDLMVFMPGTELYTTTLGDADVVSLHVSPALLTATAGQIAPGWSGIEGSQCFNRDRSRRAGNDSLGALTTAVLDGLEGRSGGAQIEEDIVTTLTRVLTDSCDSAQGLLSRTRINQLQALRSAREYIEAHLNTTIRMTDVCAYAKVSLRTLERLFCRELQVLPSGYILNRRLENVRWMLSSGKWIDKTVTEIATDQGFNHLGRFSAAYRNQFGVYPSHVRRKLFVCCKLLMDMQQGELTKSG